MERSDIKMGYGRRRSALLSLGGALVIAGALALWWSTQQTGEATTTAAEPAVLEPIDGTSLKRVRLTERAAERIELETTPVRRADAAGSGMPKLVVPYSAVLYDTEGQTWVYTSPERLAFVRAPVDVERFEGSLAYLTDGPPGGTPVVSVGAPLLFGTEFGVDH